MIIDLISDLHGCKPALHGGDLLIIAGDLTARDKPPEYDTFDSWLKKQKYNYKIVIAGNHDGLLQKFPNRNQIVYDNGMRQGRLASAHAYLCDSGTYFERLRIWGSPWTPTFCNWHFMLDRGAPIKAKWDLIPVDTDILITHGPMWGVLDTVYPLPSAKIDHLGCYDLRDAIERIKPRLHVCGHIHGGHGTLTLKHPDSNHNTFCVNASIMDEDYNPVNKPIRVIYEPTNRTFSLCRETYSTRT